MTDRAGAGAPVGAAEVLAFGLELCALAALAYWGAHSGAGAAAAVGLGVGAPLLAAVAWGLFAAPRARVPVLRRPVKLAVYGAAVVALAASGHRFLAVAFAVLVVADTAVVERRRRDVRP